MEKYKSAEPNQNGGRIYYHICRHICTHTHTHTHTHELHFESGRKRVFIRIKSAARPLKRCSVEVLSKGGLSDPLLLSPQLSLAVSGRQRTRCSARGGSLSLSSMCVYACVYACVCGGREGSGLGERLTTQSFETFRTQASGRCLRTLDSTATSVCGLKPLMYAALSH